MPTTSPAAAPPIAPAASFPGPEVLGRGVVLDAGQDLPDGYPVEAERVVVDDAVLADPAEVVDQLHDLWVRRRRVVVDLVVDNDALKEPEVLGEAPYDLPTDTTFLRERLRFLVWANNYDARDSGTGGHPIWWHGHVAEQRGADRGVGRDDAADISLEGTPTWVDNGPRGPLPVPSVHYESVQLGRVVHQRNTPPREQLAPDQLAAVTHGQGPARIIAPAGSGKTRVLTARLRHLLRDRGVEPELVTAIAYNTRAAAEMRERLADVPGRTNVRTIHAMAYMICQWEQRWEVLGERDVRTVLERLLKTPRIPNKDPFAPYLEALAEVRLGLRHPQDVEAERDDVDGLAEMFPRYREELARRGALDFDEQVYRAIELLLTRPDLRARAQLGCTHLLVDEFQDLTPAFLLFVRLLASPRLDVFGVGDDDQVIYGHAGASPTYLIRYDQWFPGAADHPLEVNYRCPPPVVTAADTLLSHNLVRVPKTIRSPSAPATDDPLRAGSEATETPPGGNPENVSLTTPAEPDDPLRAATAGSETPPGGNPENAPVRSTPAEPDDPLRAGSEATETPPGGNPEDAPGSEHARETQRVDDEDEALTATGVAPEAMAAHAVDLLQGWAASGTVQPTDVAVLARVNSALLPVQVACQLAGIPANTPLDATILGRTGIRAALAWIRIAQDLERIRREDLFDTLRRPPRRVLGPVRDLLPGGRLSMRILEDVHERLDGKAADRFGDYLEDLSLLADRLADGADTARVLWVIRNRIGLGEVLEVLDASKGRADGSSHTDDLDALDQLAAMHPDPRTFRQWLVDALRLPGTDQGVHLSTIHKVKGREWSRVIVFAANAGLLPHRLAEGEVEEERRVFHVAVTRCSEQVVVLANKDAPSPFIKQLTVRRKAGKPGQKAAAVVPTDTDLRRRGGPTQPTLAGEARAGAAGAANGTSTEDAIAAAGPADRAVFETLKAWRAELARAQGKPAYTIFANTTLLEIAERRPQDLRSLAAVRGVGPAKLEKYGDEVLELLADLD